MYDALGSITSTQRSLWADVHVLYVNTTPLHVRDCGICRGH